MLAVALIMTEGILGQEHGDNIEEKIRQGQRRLKDQFLPQSLIAHCGAEQAFDYSYWRIMRIAASSTTKSRAWSIFVNLP